MPTPPISPEPDAPAGEEAAGAGPIPPGDSPEDGGPRYGGLPDLLRKAMLTGLGAVFMTEEGIRALVKDLKLPKEVLAYVLGQAERSKDEVLRVVSDEVRRFLSSEALRKEVVKLLSDVTIEVSAQVRLKPDGQAISDVKVHKAAVRRGRRR